MHAVKKITTIEDQKIELIKLRIRNKFYDKEDVFDKLVHELLNKELKKNI